MLVRRLGGSLLEQIAALLHDVSHTAFSHVIDHVLSTPTGKSYHEVMKAIFLQQSDIPAVLTQYGYRWQDLLDDTRYSLLEQAAPALCADRLDYFLRDGQALGLVTLPDVARVLAHLAVQEGRMVVTDLATASWLAIAYLQTDDQSLSNPQALGLCELTARALRQGFALGALTEAALWQTDQQVWDQLRRFPDLELQQQLTLVASLPQFAETDVAPELILMPKVRTIDPPVLVQGVVLPLSTLDADFKAQREAYLQRKQGQLNITVRPSTP